MDGSANVNITAAVMELDEGEEEEEEVAAPKGKGRPNQELKKTYTQQQTGVNPQTAIRLDSPKLFSFPEQSMLPSFFFNQSHPNKYNK